MASSQGQATEVKNLKNNGESEKLARIPEDTEDSPLTDKKNHSAENQEDVESGGKPRGKFTYESLAETIRTRSRLLYITTACLCALLLIVIIFLIAFWPNVPFYLKAEICTDKACVLASQQLLLWSNISISPCTDPYTWACGSFKKEYDDDEFFVVNKGEWDTKAFFEYQELKDLNIFISTLSTGGESTAIESIISGLYRSCREIEILDKSQSDLLLRKAMKSIDNWHAFRDGRRLQFWDYRKALLQIQTNFGVFPFYKLSVENRFNKPFEYIITLDAGEVGLPDKFFYKNEEVVSAYKMLLRDFAINMGIVVREADLFADKIIHYEERIVNHIGVQDTSGERRVNQIKTIEELKKLAPSLPIFDSVKAIFPQVKITEETEVLVRDVDVIQAMSIVISTSDKQPLNDFIIWSLARNLIPYLSREYRVLTEKFEQTLYGRTSSNPQWLTCTHLVRSWLAFGVDALQQSPGLVKSSPPSTHPILYSKDKSKFSPNRTHGNDELLRLMFSSVRNQVQKSVRHADWIEKDLKDYICDKITSMRLQIGIPDEILETKQYVNEYYEKLLLQNFYFVEHVESLWSFRKLQMSAKLKPLNILDMIISETYSNEKFHPITYSTALNMILVTKRLYWSNYYDYRFPISVNFARLGFHLTESLLTTIPTFIKQYNEESNAPVDETEILKLDQSCVEEHLSEEELPDDVLQNLHITLSASRIAPKALSSFVRAIDNKEPIVGASINPAVTYESLGLANRRRNPGLRPFSDNELFSLSHMQLHCNTPLLDKDYSEFKPHIDRKVSEKELFNIVWNHVPFLSRSVSCSTPKSSHKCTNLF